MTEGWKQWMPTPSEVAAGRAVQVEHSTVNRILRACPDKALVKQIRDAAETENEGKLSFAICEGMGFPVRLRAVVFDSRELGRIFTEIRKRITKTKLWAAYEALRATVEDSTMPVGIVFSDRTPYVFHDCLPLRLGTEGQYWRVDDRYYFLEHIDSLLDRVADSWSEYS